MPTRPLLRKGKSAGARRHRPRAHEIPSVVESLTSTRPGCRDSARATNERRRACFLREASGRHNEKAARALRRHGGRSGASSNRPSPGDTPSGAATSSDSERPASRARRRSKGWAVTAAPLFLVRARMRIQRPAAAEILLRLAALRGHRDKFELLHPQGLDGGAGVRAGQLCKSPVGAAFFKEEKSWVGNEPHPSPNPSHHEVAAAHAMNVRLLCGHAPSDLRHNLTEAHLPRAPNECHRSVCAVKPASIDLQWKRPHYVGKYRLAWGSVWWWGWRGDQFHTCVAA